MPFMIAAVGRSRPGPERALYEHYLSRLREPVLLREVEEKKPLPVPDRMAREGRLLLSCVPTGSKVVVLDERGRMQSSRDFASALERWLGEGTSTISFLIGGADGHDPAVRDRADLLLGFGSMTWPHMLVRGMLAEQLYRARCIMDGHPYHRD